jgi:hypothetical protein
MDHMGPSSTKAGGGSSNVATLQDSLSEGLRQLQNMGVNTARGPFSGAQFPGSQMFHPIWGGGPGSAVGGARGLGSLPSLDASLKELVVTLNDLAAALAKTTGGGNVDQATDKPKTDAPTTDSGSGTSTSSGTSTDTST